MSGHRAHSRALRYQQVVATAAKALREGRLDLQQSNRGDQARSIILRSRTANNSFTDLIVSSFSAIVARLPITSDVGARDNTNSNGGYPVDA